MNTPNSTANEALLAYRFKAALANEDYLLCQEITGIVSRRILRGTINTYAAIEPFRSLDTGLIDYAEYNGLFDELEMLRPELYCSSVAPAWAIRVMAGFPLSEAERNSQNNFGPVGIMNSEDDLDFPSQMLGDLS